MCEMPSLPVEQGRKAGGANPFFGLNRVGSGAGKETLGKRSFFMQMRQLGLGPSKKSNIYNLYIYIISYIRI